MQTRFVVAALVVALAYWQSQPAPEEKPDAPLAVDLSQCFDSEDGAEDAAVVATMCSEIADVIEWDGMQVTPLLSTGVALDEMRTRTREFMCRGESLGDKYPCLRETVASFLDSRLGSSGGLVTPEKRADWVRAYRDIARSARAVFD
jgi:hypothetical protein